MVETTDIWCPIPISVSRNFTESFFLLFIQYDYLFSDPRIDIEGLSPRPGGHTDSDMASQVL